MGNLCTQHFGTICEHISVEEVMEEEGQVIVRCIISAGSSQHFSASSAKVRFLHHFTIINMTFSRKSCCFSGYGVRDYLVNTHIIDTTIFLQGRYDVINCG